MVARTGSPRVGLGQDSVSTLSPDNTGNVFVGGTFRNTPADVQAVKDFSGAPLLGQNLVATYTDVYIAKLSDKSTQQWIATLGGTVNDTISSIAVDSSANVYVVGTYTNTSANARSVKDFAGGALNGKSGISSLDVFIAKLDANGTQQWIRTLGGTGSDTGSAVAVDASGNVFVAGNFMNSSSNSRSVTDFSSATLNGKTAATVYSDIFVAKLDTSGTQLWIKTLGGSQSDMAGGLAVDASGNCYVSGVYANSSANSSTVTDFASATLNGKSATALGDGFVAKLSSAGVQQWIVSAGGTQADTAGAVSVDGSGNVYVSGQIYNTASDGDSFVDFGGISRPGLTSSDTANSYIAKLNSSGVEQWFKTLGGDGGSNIFAVAIDALSNIYAVGFFSNDTSDTNHVISFDGTQLLGVSASVNSDGFLAKLTSAGSQSSIKRMGGAGNDLFSAAAINSQGALLTGGSFENDSANANKSLNTAGYTLLGRSTSITQDGFITKQSPP